MPSTDARRTLLAVVRSSRPLSPSQVERLGSRYPNQRILLVVPSASPAAVAVATAHGWSVVTTSGRGSRLVLGDDVHDLPKPLDPNQRLASPRNRGRPAYGTFAVARRLLDGRPITQGELVLETGLSQPRVSQVLTDLARRGLVARWSEEQGGSWFASDWDGFLNWWLETYPGPGGVATSWFGLRPVREQAVAAIAAVRAVGGRGVMSGDVAADELAPWRLPHSALVYVDLRTARNLDLAGVLARSGLTPAGVDQATLEIRFPADPAVWGDDVDAPLPVADPVQVLWDVQRSGGPDADQAEAKLREVLSERAARQGVRS